MLFIIGAVNSNAQSEKEKPPPPPPRPPRIDIKKFVPPAKELQAFYKRNPAIANAHWQGTNTIILKTKAGKQEKYNLENESEKKVFADKYGEAPLKPPPPPPPKPKAI